MKLVSHYFEQITGVENFSIVVLILFMTLFLGILYIVIKENPLVMKEYANMPLEENESEKLNI